MGESEFPCVFWFHCVCVYFLGSASVAGLKPYVESVWALLLKHCECQEEGTRNVVAECLGKLTLIDPETLLPRLKGYLLSGDQHTVISRQP